MSVNEVARGTAQFCKWAAKRHGAKIAGGVVGVLLGGPWGGAAGAAAGIVADEKLQKYRDELWHRGCNAGKLQQALTEMFATFLVIDSNILMNDWESYCNLFNAFNRVLKEQGKQITLYGPQFDEICNIKKSTDFGDQRNGRARCAIERIEWFQKEGLLSIKPISIDAEKGVYADPLIIKLLMANAREGNPVTFISDDKELRVRARQLLQDLGNGCFKIFEGNELASLAPDFCKHNKMI